jgi:hypothetical protein
MYRGEDFAAVVYPSEAPSPPRFLFGGGVTESGQIQSVKLLQNMVSNRAPYPHPLQYSILIHTGKGSEEGGGGNEREG